MDTILCGGKAQAENVQAQLDAAGITDVRAIVLQTNSRGETYYTDERSAEVVLMAGDPAKTEFDGTIQDADGNPIARAMTKTYAEGFYMGLRAGLHFKIDEAKHTVTATVTIYRDKDLTDKIYSDSLIIDLRYDIPVKTEVTATKKPA